MTVKSKSIPETLRLDDRGEFCDSAGALFHLAVSRSMDSADANAIRQEIARRYNAHDALVAAIKELIPFVCAGAADYEVAKAKAAIAQAEKE